MRKIRIPRISKKMVEQKRKEIEVRIALAKRCGGEFNFDGSLTGGKCFGGRCESCNRQMPKRPKSEFDILSPHEKIHRSQGKAGAMSLDNSIMLCNNCHMQEHNLRPVNSKPQWGK